MKRICFLYAQVSNATVFIQVNYFIKRESTALFVSESLLHSWLSFCAFLFFGKVTIFSTIEGNLELLVLFSLPENGVFFKCHHFNNIRNWHKMDLLQCNLFVLCLLFIKHALIKYRSCPHNIIGSIIFWFSQPNPVILIQAQIPQRDFQFD